jgi:hypothetical protein
VVLPNSKTSPLDTVRRTYSLLTNDKDTILKKAAALAKLGANVESPEAFAKGLAH